MAPSSDSLTLPIPDAFPSFPYSPPYPIQVELMKHVYDTIEQQKVAIVESPTGTGKTLSLLCGTLTWLADDKERRKRGQLKSLQGSLQGDNEPDWVLEQTFERHKREMETEELEFEQRLEKARRKEESLRRMAKARVHKKQKLTNDHPNDESEDEDAAFLPEDEGGVDGDGLSPAVKALMKSLADSRTKESVREVEEPTCTKIFYASRTHSQLAQLRGELLKTTHSTTRVVPLASRKNLCINETLRAKGDNATDLDEGCRELLNEKKGKRCPHLPPPDEEHKMLEFRDHVLATPKDIEELVTIGKELNTCPYFGSRRAIPQAQLVTLPYNLLLQKSARDALGIDLSDHVVVVDEAHNLIDTLLSIHTVSLSSHILDTSLQQLTFYLNRFRKRLASTHGLHLRRLLRFLNTLKVYIDKWKLTATSPGQTAPAKQEIMAASNLMSLLGPQVDGVNLVEIEAYLKRSKIARKISGYSDKAYEKDREQARARRRATPPLHTVEDFILALTNGDADGRLSLSLSGEPGKENVTLKYQLLNPSNHFKEVVEAARSVILAGGTMSPIGDFQFQLFPFLAARQLNIFTCGHVIPSANLQTLVIGKGPRGGELQFKYDQRGNQDMLAELGQVLTNLVNLVPHGLVVFFPSYAFLGSVKGAFQKSGLLEKLDLKKKLFFEPESTSEVDSVLRQYALAVSSSSTASKKGGALLFAVVGAKLSEGINFSDSLARAVVIVGLPFPSLASIELKERMRYVAELEKSLGMARAPGTKDAGTELYENLCMKSVNQSIGRAIRHQNDFASLILVDSRYASSRISGKLPKWIGKDLVITENFGHAVREVGRFFRSKN
ncbi:DNA repair helicase [Ramaria rubella]|nr:DNA repair helicase [Ramaria rubella]